MVRDITLHQSDLNCTYNTAAQLIKIGRFYQILTCVECKVTENLVHVKEVLQPVEKVSSL